MSLPSPALALSLYLTVFLEHLTEENRPGGSAQSSGDTKPKSVKAPDIPEGDGTRPSADGSQNLPPSQSEVEKGSQRKSQVKRKDQRGPESLDSQTKPGAKSAAPLYRRGPGTTQCPGNKGSEAKAQLRRNASSAGRLQGLYNSSPGRRESKNAEAYLPSGKQRPRSLEMTTYSSKGEPPGPEALLAPEETMTLNPHSSPGPMKVAILNEETTPVLEKSSGNPEPSMVPKEETLKNILSKTSLTGEKNRTMSLKENETERPETPESSGKTAGSSFCESCNSEMPLSLWENAAQTPEDPAACKGTLPPPPLQNYVAGIPGCLQDPSANVMQALKMRIYTSCTKSCIEFQLVPELSEVLV